MKKILAATALAGFLAAGPAFAQDATTPANPPAAAPSTTDDMNAPAAAPPAVTPDTAATPDATATPNTATAATTERFITMEAADDWLASRMIGSTVYGSGDEDLGKINDVVVASNGQIKAIIIGVGGFLGIGEKNVAVNPSIIERVRQDNAVRYRLATTKDELTAAPEFKALDETAPATTGSTAPAAPAVDPAPAPAPATPAQ